MSNFIDLSHSFQDGMPGFRMKKDDGEMIEYTANIRPFLTHDQTKPFFENDVSFEITQLEFQSSVGTYIDSPYHRYSDRDDISKLEIKNLICEGIVIDARGLDPQNEFEIDSFSGNEKLMEKAVLFNFGWDQYWGEDRYREQPFISENILDTLIENQVKLVGVDTINIDDSRDLSRPAHSKLLYNDIPIIENMTNLDMLYGKHFRFFAVPIKAKNTAAMPIRAFAEILG